MRLKIKQVHPSPEEAAQQQQQQQHRQDQEYYGGDQQIMKKEIIDEEDDRGSGSQWQKSEENNQPILSNSSDTNDNVSNHHSEPFPTIPVVSDSLGKRKRKPKQYDQISPVFIRRRRKKSFRQIRGNGLSITVGKRNPELTRRGEKLIPGLAVHFALHLFEVVPYSEGKSMRQEKVDDGSSTPVQIKSPTLIRAEELQSSLGNEYPCFVKLLGRSHIGSCFRMGLPVPFCKSHLPQKEAILILENENGEQFEIRYIAEKTGLGAGWRKFVATHKLVEGDAMTFQLTGPTTFKVYVTRANDMTEVDGALSLLNLEAHTKQSDADGPVAASRKRQQRPKSLSLALVQTKIQTSQPLKSIMPRLEEQSGNDSEEVASEVMESSKFSEDALGFMNIKNFEDFHILVNGVCIDSELPEHIRRKYYDLCCIKNCYLHERFLPGLYSKLAAAMIFEAVNTTDAIRACKVTTSRNEFEKWEKSLKSFELLGMNVGFIRDRLRWLISLAFDAEEAVEAKRYWEVKTLQARVKDDIEDLEAKLLELKEDSDKYDIEIDALKSKAESYEVMFQEELNASW